MSENKKFKTINEYIDSHPKEIRKALIELRFYIFEAAPNATELFNYNIPAYALIEGGKREQQIMMAGYKTHIAFSTLIQQ